LVGQHQAGKARPDGRTNGTPARHDLADVLFAPQAEGEAVRPRRDPGDNAVAGGPFLKLHPGNGRVSDGYLTEDAWGGSGGRGGRQIVHLPPSLALMPPSSLLSVSAPSPSSRSSFW